MLASLLLPLILARPSLAADLVLHEAGRPDALERAREVLPDLAVDARASTLASLVQGLPPQLPAPAELRMCDSAPLSNAALSAAAATAAGQVAYLEYDDAAATLDAVLARLPCLTEQVAADLAVKAWFLRGFVATELGQQDRAGVAFRQALFFRPDLAWNTDYPDTGKAALEQARAHLGSETGSIALAPPAAKDRVYVDGQQVDGTRPLQLAAGEHLLQVVGDSVLSMVVSTGSAEQSALVLPALLADQDLHAATVPEGRAALDPVLDLAVEADDRVVVLVGDKAWVRSGGTWQAAAASAPPTTAETRSGRGLARGLRWSGVAVAAGGLALSGVSWALASDAVGDADTAVSESDAAAYEAAQGRYGTAGVLLPVGYGLAGLGGALLVTGFALDADTGLRLGPALLPGGGGLRLELCR